MRGLEQALDDLGRAGPRATAPAPTVGIAFDSRRGFAASALELERQTVDAYRNVLTGFRDDNLLQPLGSIMACGAQHEVALRQVLGARSALAQLAPGAPVRGCGCGGRCSRSLWSSALAPQAHAAWSFQLGIGEQQTAMFGDPRFEALGVKPSAS